MGFSSRTTHELFWAGTEFELFNNALKELTHLRPFATYSCYKGEFQPPVMQWAYNPLKSPPSYGYPELPPNWESAADMKRHKPSTQTFARTWAWCEAM